MRSFDRLRTGLHAALRRAGLRQVRFHDLRHSFASNLLGKWWGTIKRKSLMQKITERWQSG
jgi:integrase